MSRKLEKKTHKKNLFLLQILCCGHIRGNKNVDYKHFPEGRGNLKYGGVAPDILSVILCFFKLVECQLAGNGSLNSSFTLMNKQEWRPNMHIWADRKHVTICPRVLFCVHLKELFVSRARAQIEKVVLDFYLFEHAATVGQVLTLGRADDATPRSCETKQKAGKIERTKKKKKQREDNATRTKDRCSGVSKASW